MSDFDSIAAQAVADAMQVMGKDAQYLPTDGDSVPVRVQLRHDQELVGDFGQVGERTTVLSVSAAQVSSVRRDEVFVVDGTEYRVVRTIGNSGFVLRIAVTTD